MNDRLIRAWNSVCTQDSIVWHLGDMFLCGSQMGGQIMDRLQFKELHLVLGNHDRTADAHHQWFTSVQHYAELRVRVESAEIPLVLMHYPIESWNGRSHGAWHLHGHVHGNNLNGAGRMDVGVDNCRGYKPQTMEDIRQTLTCLGPRRVQDPWEEREISFALGE